MSCRECGWLGPLPRTDPLVGGAFVWTGLERVDAVADMRCPSAQPTGHFHAPNGTPTVPTTHATVVSIMMGLPDSLFVLGAAVRGDRPRVAGPAVCGSVAVLGMPTLGGNRRGARSLSGTSVLGRVVVVGFFAAVVGNVAVQLRARVRGSGL